MNKESKTSFRKFDILEVATIKKHTFHYYVLNHIYTSKLKTHVRDLFKVPGAILVPDNTAGN